MSEIHDFKLNNQLMKYIMVDGEPWFRGHDIVIVLGHTRPSSAIRDRIPNNMKNAFGYSKG